MLKLGVNVDHIATVRQARRCKIPDPVEAALICEKAGADSIVCHLREDRRHINDADVKRLRQAVRTRLNLEMSIAKDIVKIAKIIKPDQATIVPERRKEITTEGGLDLIRDSKRIKLVVEQLMDEGIRVSLFIDPDKKQIQLAKDIGAEFIELHTGKYCDATSKALAKRELNRLIEATQYAIVLGLRVNAGHGLDYNNVKPVARISGIEELNIGFSIISHAVFVGLENAVKQMLALM